MTPQARSGGAGVRPEIQALRAVAVALVVLYHLWPDTIPGGYVGVDVFFVISGFLITSHLARPLLDGGRVSLSAFYARRIRRLLPASLVVLLVVAIATFVLMPQALWPTVGTQTIASAFYVQNWVLAFESVDYLAVASDASPLQHFWSLSAEEQFYLVWPVAVIAGAVLAARVAAGRSRRGGRPGRPRARRAGIIAVIALIAAASLTYSIVATAADPAWAYFITPTRAWEFALGGLAAVALPVLRAPVAVRAALSWAGLVAIGLSAWLYSGATPFPGIAAALPVAGALAVIVAGDVPLRWAPAMALNVAPVQRVGDWSYSLYLWHWPLIVFVPIAIGGYGSPLTDPQRFGILAATVLLGWLSTRFVEDRFRSRRVSEQAAGPASARGAAATRRRRGVVTAFAGAAVGMVVVGSLGAAAIAITSERARAAQVALADLAAVPNPCVGASDSPGCTEVDGLFPDPMIARESVPFQECQQNAAGWGVVTCELGVPAEGARARIALVGDSHATQWLPALTEIAERHGIAITTYLKGRCAFIEVPGEGGSCGAWNDAVAAALLAADDDAVLTTASRLSLANRLGQDDTTLARATEGFRAAWSPLLAAGIPVVALAETPRPSWSGVPDPPLCVEEGADCTLDRDRALLVDLQAQAAADDGVPLVDLTDQFCDERACPAVINNALVYRDDSHITSVFARSLAPALEERLRAAGLPAL